MMVGSDSQMMAGSDSQMMAGHDVVRYKHGVEFAGENLVQ